MHIRYVIALGTLNLKGKLFSYADDIALIISKTSWKTSVKSAEAGMCKINEWYSKHNLRLNFHKNKYIAFSQN